MTWDDILNQLAETAYNAYWERVTEHCPHLRTPFSKQEELYKEDWRRVAKAVAEEVKYDI
jgi:hypothetical protein